MSRRALFREADLARALKVVQGAGVTVGRVEIDAEGRIVIVSRSPSQVEDEGRGAAQASLEALRERLKRDGARPAGKRAGLQGAAPRPLEAR